MDLPLIDQFCNGHITHLVPIVCKSLDYDSFLIDKFNDFSRYLLLNDESFFEFFYFILYFCFFDLIEAFHCWENSFNLSLGVLDFKFTLHFDLVKLLSILSDIFGRLTSLDGVVILLIFEVNVDLLYFLGVRLLLLFEDIVPLLLLHVIFDLFLKLPVNLRLLHFAHGILNHVT